MPMDPIPVIDLFAGPGGMSEGFSSLRDENGEPVFRSIMSIEMERTAHATLRLRAFARRLMDADGRLPQDYIDYLGTPSSENLERLKDSHPEEWAAAEAEAIQGTLKEGDDEFVEMAKKRLQGYDGPLVLIGGPPCQAYSLVGRARRTHDKDRLEKDVKQTLYKCYLLRDLRCRSSFRAIRVANFLVHPHQSLSRNSNLRERYPCRRTTSLLRCTRRGI